VMVELELKRLNAPDFTATIREGTPSLIVLNEEAVPSIFWEPREPRRAEIPGVALSNTEPVLSVRVR
jgi:hypothetical protein